MKFAKLTALGMGLMGGILQAVAQDTNAPAPYDHFFQNNLSEISYAIGAKFGGDVGNVVKRVELEADMNALIRGFEDRLAGTPKITDAQVQEIIDKFQATLQKALSDKHHKDGDAFRASFKQGVGVVETASGLLYKPLSGANSGIKPGSNDTVTVNYRLTLIDGTECDSSYKRGQPGEFALAGVVRGWQEALQLMPVGAKWQIVMPPELAYGEQGAEPLIGPGSTLIFEVELISTRPPARAAVNGMNSPIIEVPSMADIQKGKQPRMLTPEEADAIAAQSAKNEQGEEVVSSKICGLLRWSSAVAGMDLGDDMSLPEYILLAFSSLFVIVDPLAALPAFIAMTPTDPPAERTRMAKLACWVMGAVLIIFALAGKLIFRLLGITMPAFQLAASVVLLLVALDMLRAKRSRVQETDEETAAGAEKTDIAITPLAIPMLSGPGAISTAILLENRAQGWAQKTALCFCIAGVAFVSFLVLRIGARGARWLSPIAMSIAIRIMGLLLAAVAMQFAVDAIRGLRLELFAALTD